MRKLMWFTVGFSVACAVGAYFIFGMWLPMLAAFCLLAFFSLRFMATLPARRISCALLGCAMGLAWLCSFDWFYLKPPRQMNDQTVMLKIQVTDYSEQTGYGTVAEGKILLNGLPYTVQFYLDNNATLSPGDIVEGSFRLLYTGSGAEKTTYYCSNGTFLLCYQESDCVITLQTEIPAQFLAPKLRRQILGLLESIFPEDTGAFAKALLLGDTSGLSYESVTALKISGIYHVVAVSGQHVSILFALIYLLCGKRRVLTTLLGLPLLVLFTAVAGFSPSIVRACIMQVLMILALLLNKEYDPPTALAFAVLVLLGCNPLAITHIGMQLSVGCVAGIFLVSQRIHDYLLHETRLSSAKGKSIKARLIRWVVMSVSITMGAMLLTTPLIALYFGSVSIAGLITNLLTLWMITLIFYAVIVACVLGSLWLPIGVCLGWVISWPIRFVLWMTDVISKIPVSAVYTSSIYIVVWLVFVYVILAVFLKMKKKHPVVMTCCIFVGLIGAVVCSWLEPGSDNYRITAIDVGQGQCLLLQNERKNYMVDCGGDSDTETANRAIQVLWSQGIFRLDGLILTHYDDDHAGAAQKLLARIPADIIYLPVLDEASETRDELSAKYSEKILWVNEDLVLDEANITIFASLEKEDDNESSLCVLFQPENCDILITGDRSKSGELALMNHADLPDLEILVVGHHGSRYATSWELLNATRPEIAIISVGKDNRYGHPTWETLERLRLFGCDVYRTDIKGTIVFRG